MAHKRHLLSRRAFLRAAAGGTGMVLLAACGGNNSSSNGSTTTTTNDSGGGQRTPEQLNFQGPPTEVATEAQTGSNLTQGTGGGRTAVATQGAAPTLPVPTSFKEAPSLTEQVKSGKLPEVRDRLPENPMVVRPVDKVGVYGGTWHTAFQGPGHTAWLTRTIGYENLVRWERKTTAFSLQEVIPNIAASFEIKQNGQEYTFKLREGMRWSDGKPFTAADIMFWYEDVYSNDELTPTKPDWLTSGGKPVKVTKRDEQTVVFSFDKPNGLFLQRLATPSGDALTSYPAHYMKQFHKKYNPKVTQKAKQAGVQDWTDLFFQQASAWDNDEVPVLFPWKLTTPVGKATQQLVAERNPYYWKVDPEGSQLPYLDQTVYYITEKLDVAVLKALDGQIDMQDLYINDLSNKPVFYKNQKKGNYHLFDEIHGGMNTVMIALNLTTRNRNLSKVFNDINFRIGLSYAINRQEIVDVLYVSQGEPWQGAPRPESPFYDEKLAKQYTEYNVKKANEYLDKVLPEKDAKGRRLGPDGKPFAFTVEVDEAESVWLDTMNMVKQYWRDVGVSIEVKQEGGEIFYVRKNGNSVDATVWDGDGGMDALLEPRWYFPYSTESNYAIPWALWFMSPKEKGAIKPPAPARKQMKLYRQITTTGDLNKQTALMKEILNIAREQFWAMGISLPANEYGIAKNDFHNVPKQMLGSWLYPTPAPTDPEQYFIDGK